MSCVKLPATASNFTSDESALKMLWLMVCNIEDKRLAKRAKEGRRVARLSRPPCRGRESLWVETSHQPNGCRLPRPLRPIPLEIKPHPQLDTLLWWWGLARSATSTTCIYSVSKKKKPKPPSTESNQLVFHGSCPRLGRSLVPTRKPTTRSCP